jgi:hypothetical protein
MLQMGLYHLVISGTFQATAVSNVCTQMTQVLLLGEGSVTLLISNDMTALIIYRWDLYSKVTMRRQFSSPPQLGVPSIISCFFISKQILYINLPH